MTVEDGQTVAEPAKPAKNGYDFGGWQNGEAAYDFSAAVKSDLTLTAKWTVKTYTITYELNGGTNSAENPTEYTIETDEITLKDPTGPTAAPVFQGWYSDKEFLNRVNPVVIAKGSTDDKTFYARFGTVALKEFTVTFNVVAKANGTVLGTDSIKVNDGDKISDAQLEAAKGKIASLGEYEYDGIYTDAALKAAFDTSARITADTTLYVKVKAVQKFTVTFDSDGGSAVAAVTVKSGEKAAKPADPAKDGFTFKGWLLGDADYNFETPVTGDITLKAKWEAKAVEPTVEKLASTWVPGTSYAGTVEYDMVKNGEYTNASASDVMFNIDVSGLELKEKDSITVEFKVTECDGTISQIGCGSAIDNWEWHPVPAKDLGSAYKFSLDVGSTTSFENNLAGIKFVPQDSDGALIGKKLTIKIEGLKVTHVPYVAGAETRVSLYEGEGFKGYQDNFDASKLKEYLDSSANGAKLVFTYTLGDYTPEWDYDGIAILAGWDTSGTKWKDSYDNFDNYGFNIPCAKADYADKIGTVQTKEFDVETLLSDLENTHKFTINIYADADKTPKAVFTKIEVVYTAK